MRGDEGAEMFLQENSTFIFPIYKTKLFKLTVLFLIVYI